MTNVVERSGYSCVPTENCPSEESVMPASRNAKRASSRFLMTGQPVWKPSQAGTANWIGRKTARPACRVAKRQRDRALRDAERHRRRDIGIDRLQRAWPRHRVHQHLEYALGLEHRLGKAAGQSFGGMDHQSSPRTIVKKSTRVAAVSSACLSLGGGDPVVDRRQQRGFDEVLRGALLPEGVEDCGEPRPLAVGAERMRVADCAGGEPHGGARDGHFAEIEGRAAAAYAAAHHDEACLRTAHRLGLRLFRKRGPGSIEFFARCPCQEIGDALARPALKRREFLPLC